jgi:hypothetical protein
MGRPSEYNAKRPDQARFICEHWGADDLELAKGLGISPATLYDWKKEHPEFLEAVLAGKRAYDAAIVEKAIQSCAVGYEYVEEIWDSKLQRIVRLRKYHHSDPRAQALWMMNRQGWRPPGSAPELPAGRPAGEDRDGGGEQDPREGQLAKEILEHRHKTTIHVESEVIDVDPGDNGTGGAVDAEPGGRTERETEVPRRSCK